LTILVKNNRDESLGGLITFTSGVVLTNANVTLATGTGTQIGTATTQKLAFLGSTPVVQRSGSAQAAASTGTATSGSPWGYSTAAQANAVITLLNEIRATLVALGLMKGSA
jgi:UDP-N-acetyl-D-mannosaminuronic acid transferase (WecB/TagA/CpsF family)